MFKIFKYREIIEFCQALYKIPNVKSNLRLTQFPVVGISRCADQKHKIERMKFIIFFPFILSFHVMSRKSVGPML